MESYRILLFLHIVSVIVGLGVTFAYPFLQGFAERTSVGATRFVLRWIRRTELMVVYPGVALIAIFGVGLIFDDTTGYRDDFPGWLGIAIAWYVAAVLVSAFVQRPNVEKALRTIADVPDDGSFPPAYLDVSRQLQIVGGLLGLSVVGIAALMVWGKNGGF